nr:MAG: internal scaffolding protein [Microvirus sp.]
MKKKEYLQHEFNGSFDLLHTKVPVQDKLMQLSTMTLKDGSIVVSSDISLIFNQQRLENKIAVSELREYIQRYTPNKSVYVAQLDDDTLLSTLKSRHIQSLSEMRAWTEYCMENFDSLIKEAEERARLDAEAAAASSSVVDTSSASATSE